MMPAHSYSAPPAQASLICLTPLADLADALIQRGHEARLIVSAAFVAVRTPHGAGPFERIYLCDGHFRWAGSPAAGRDIASHDDVSRAADAIAEVLGGDLGTSDRATPAGTVNSRLYPRGGPTAEAGTP